MSTAQKTLIDAIRRIALDSEALASALGDLQKRGVIDGIKTTLGGYSELQDDCCTDGDGNPDDPSGEKDPIDEDAPPEVPEIGDEDGDGESEWSDCETGDPVTFAPGGFPQPETCKDCEPDEGWQEGYYWETFDYTASQGGYFSAGKKAATPTGAAHTGSWGYDNGESGSNRNVYRYSWAGVTPSSVTGNYINILRTEIDYFNAGGSYRETVTLEGTGAVIYRRSCGSSTADYCTLTEPPEKCVDWEPDNTTSYTLADGCITASSCDPEASAQAQQCNECITICNEDGEERRVCAIGNGQWILYDPNGKYNGGRYDATGRRLEILPAGETGGYLPTDDYDGSYDGGTIGGGDGWVWS